MREEMSALQKNKTWEIVERPKGKNIIDYKWIFTLKYKASGSLERHKARLVAKGYTQTYGVDYQETFAPIAKMNTVRILLSLAAHYNWQLLQYDVKNVFHWTIYSPNPTIPTSKHSVNQKQKTKKVQSLRSEKNGRERESESR